MTQKEKIYYVYRYWDPIRQEYIYVGKGKGKRFSWSPHV
jgi:hypothetical protein